MAVRKTSKATTKKVEAPAAPTKPHKDTVVLDWLIARLSEKGGAYANLARAATEQR